MDKYMRLWHESGDYLEFPPDLHYERKVPYFDYCPNSLETPESFPMNEEDLLDLINWCNDKLDQLRKVKSPVETGL